ncbi:MAG: hypothetical protein ACLTYC_11815, partial [Ruminococcus callidus]
YLWHLFIQWVTSIDNADTKRKKSANAIAFPEKACYNRIVCCSDTLHRKLDSGNKSYFEK